MVAILHSLEIIIRNPQVLQSDVFKWLHTGGNNTFMFSKIWIYCKLQQFIKINIRIALGLIQIPIQKYNNFLFHTVYW